MFTFVAMVRVSKLLGSNINPNPNSNFALQYCCPDTNYDHKLARTLF